MTLHTGQARPIAAGPDDGPPVVVLAETDDALAQRLEAGLAAEGIAVAACRDGAEALLRAGIHDPAVVLLGTPLPVVDAARVTRLLKALRPRPVIVGVDADDAGEALAALAAGAFAAVARPYRLAEIMPLLRPHLVAPPEHRDGREERLAVGDVELDMAGLRAFVRGRPLYLTLREFEILRYFMRRPDRVISRDRLLHDIWGSGTTRDNTLTVHVKRVREKLLAAGGESCTIGTVRGRGYRLERPGTPPDAPTALTAVPHQAPAPDEDP